MNTLFDANQSVVIGDSTEHIEKSDFIFIRKGRIMPTSWQNAVTRSVSWSSASSGANAARA